MTLLKVALAGIVNALLLGLAFGLLMRQIPAPPTYLIALLQGAGAGIILGHMLWVMNLRKSKPVIPWRRLLLSLVLADLAAIPLVAVAVWVFAPLDFNEIWLAVLVLNVLVMLAFALLSMAIANRVLGSRADDGSGHGTSEIGVRGRTE